ncbi:hypothetical protein BGZ83_005007 [Gryganskiella cystojenkinii]|nr:hypothetical protein BGZ83_005007 [Gryganskiella cystojenkinii]
MSTMSLNSLQQHEDIAAAHWTMDRVVQWLRGRAPYAYLEPLFIEHQICGRAFLGLSNTIMKQLDPNSSYYQRRKLLFEIKEAIEGAGTAASVSSIGPENMPTPPPT